MVNDISRLLINELLDLNINYKLSDTEITHLIPLFEILEKTKNRNIIKPISETKIEKKEKTIHLLSSKFTNTFIKDSVEKDIQEFGTCIELYHPDGNIKVCIFGKNQQEINEYKDTLLNVIIFTLHCCVGKCYLESINIFLTDLKKEIDQKDIFDHNKSKSLQNQHVNSGLTIHYKLLNTSDIYLWRKEEIIKVCIHELIHSLQWDLRSSESAIFSIFKNKLNINKKILLSEAYTEGWAEILNCYFCAQSIEKDPKEIFCRFIHYIELETIFSFWQVYKIISLTNSNKSLTLNSFLNITDKDTHVFPYYFITACILFNIADWSCLCSNICNNYINFISSDNNNKLITNWFIQNISDPNFYLMCKKIKKQFNNENKKIYNTMRMTLIELL